MFKHGGIDPGQNYIDMLEVSLDQLAMAPYELYQSFPKQTKTFLKAYNTV